MTPFQSTFRRASTVGIPARSSRSQTRLQSTRQPESSTAPQKEETAPEPSRLVPWLLRVAYPLGRYAVIPFYFRKVQVFGREHLPKTGPVILAPTHRSRWDALLVPYAAGFDVTGRHLRFMVSADEVTGLQGWFIRRMGGFAINTRHPAIATLRHGVELLQDGEPLVIFPEGDIFRERGVQPLKPGLARLALQAESSREPLGIQIVPIAIRYSDPTVSWRSQAVIHIGAPLKVSDYRAASGKQAAKGLTADLQKALETLMDKGDESFSDKKYSARTSLSHD